MSDDRSACGRTAQIMADRLGNPEHSEQAVEAARHIADCPVCRAELEALTPVTRRLGMWQEQAAPDWQRHQSLSATPRQRLWSAWQWAPLAASLVLAVAVLFNVRISGGSDGWTLAFGGTVASDDQVAALESRWRQALLDSQQQMAAATASELESVIRWVEGQRETDLRRLEAGFEQMLQREYETTRSIHQLASYMQERQP